MTSTARAPDDQPSDPEALLADIYARPGFLIRRAYQILMAIAEEECAQIGLTPHQHSCISVLHRCGRLDQNTLARALGMDRATLGQLLRRLEAKGLIERSTARSDQRRKLVALSLQGQTMVAAAETVAQRVGERLTAMYCPADRERLTQLLQHLTTTLNSVSGVPLAAPSSRDIRAVQP